MNRLDQFIKNKLRSHTTPVDTDQLWKDIQKKKRKLRGIFFLWWGLGVVGVFSMIFLLWNNVNSDANINNNNFETANELTLLKEIESKNSAIKDSVLSSQMSKFDKANSSNSQFIIEDSIKNSYSKEIVQLENQDKQFNANTNSEIKFMNNSISDVSSIKNKPNATKNSNITNSLVENTKFFVANQSHIRPESNSENHLNRKLFPNNLDSININNQTTSDLKSLTRSDSQKYKELLLTYDTLSIKNETKLIINDDAIVIDKQKNYANFDNAITRSDSNKSINKNDRANTDTYSVIMDSNVVINNSDNGLERISKEINDTLTKSINHKIYNPYFLKIAFGLSRVNRLFQWDSAFIPSQNKALYAFNISSTLRREIYKGFCWHGSINYNRIVLQSQYAILTIIDSVSKKHQYEYIDINGLSTIKVGDFNTKEFLFDLHTNYQRINLLDFQLGLDYTKEFGAWCPHVYVGMAYNITTITQGQIFNNRSLMHNYKDEINNNIGFSYQFGLGIEYSLNKRSRIGIGTQYQSYVNSFQRNNKVINKFSLWSFQLSYGYQF